AGANMSDFNQPTRRQDQHTPSDPDSPNQTRQTQHGSIERNPDASGNEDGDGEAFDTDDSSEVAIGDEPKADGPQQR
ncbi:MAG TPA: hypothetical protein VM096_18810, partial [Vicinamibacterales bacterium]|nr:hypothetical protein [Vicinamibacterales bacterium]